MRGRRSPTESPVLSERDEAVLSSLALNRVLSSDQLRRLHFPGLDERVARRSLGRLRAGGLVQGFSAPGFGHRRLWSATAEGRRSAGLPAPDRPGALGGSKLRHTLAVNEFCLALTEQARDRGDRFGAFHWANEVAHRLPRGGRLIADAVLSYELSSGGQAFRFLELDRGTMPLARVQAKLLRYAVYLGSGAWRGDYPVFPKLALVLQGPGEEERLAALAALAARIRAGARGLEVLLCRGADLAREGPLGPVWTWAGEEGRRGFLL